MRYDVYMSVMIKIYTCSGTSDIIDRVLSYINEVGVGSNTHLCPMDASEEKKMYLQAKYVHQHPHTSVNTISKL